VSDAIGDHDDAVRAGLLGPRGGHLAVQQARVDAHEHELDVAVPEHGSLGNGAGDACRDGGGRSCGAGRGEALGLDLHAVLADGHQRARELLGGLGIRTRSEGLDEHRKVETRNDCPGIMLGQDAARLVEGRATPKIAKDEHLLLVAQLGNRLLESSLEVIRAHLGHQGHSLDVILLAEDHLP
jgi:hypothetical protein